MKLRWIYGTQKMQTVRSDRKDRKWTSLPRECESNVESAMFRWRKGQTKGKKRTLQKEEKGNRALFLVVWDPISLHRSFISEMKADRFQLNWKHLFPAADGQNNQGLGKMFSHTQINVSLVRVVDWSSGKLQVRYTKVCYTQTFLTIWFLSRHTTNNHSTTYHICFVFGPSCIIIFRIREKHRAFSLLASACYALICKRQSRTWHTLTQ